MTRVREQCPFNTTIFAHFVECSPCFHYARPSPQRNTTYACYHWHTRSSLQEKNMFGHEHDHTLVHNMYDHVYINQNYTRIILLSQASYAPTRMCVLHRLIGFLLQREKTRNAIPHFIPLFLQFTIIAQTHLPHVTLSNCTIIPFVPISVCHLRLRTGYLVYISTYNLSCHLVSCPFTRATPSMKRRNSHMLELTAISAVCTRARLRM